ncbi:unnamed protein product [Lactuca saligna]|uniref:Uncharacterized protein n=1 Tax=Lactuca saligna TaxID=75948 RepID=A0AA35VIP3_LACSI|nr:unnamed protein product [Lactuca saligna]
MMMSLERLGNMFNIFLEALAPTSIFWLSTLLATIACNIPSFAHISLERSSNLMDHHGLAPSRPETLTTAFILLSFSISLFLSTTKPPPVIPIRRQLAVFTSDSGVFFPVVAFIALTIVNPSPPLASTATSTATYTSYFEISRVGQWCSLQ